MKESEKRLRDIITKNIADDGEKNYSIVAGAGAGKTTLLSERISKEIAAGIPIEKFAVITYTNAAATELREKIVEKLEALKGEADDQVAARIEEAILRIEMMQISTIHSFLLRILKESAFEAGITLDAQMLEEDEVKARKKDFFEEWYKKHYPELEEIRKDWTIRSRLSRGGKECKTPDGRLKRLGNQRDYSRQVLENMFMDIAELREDIVINRSSHTAKARAIATKYIETWSKPLEDWRDAVLEGRNKGVKKQLSINNLPIEAMDAINALAEYNRYAEYLSKALEIITKEINPSMAKEQFVAIQEIANDNPDYISLKPLEAYKESLAEEFIKLWERPLQNWSEEVDANNPLKKNGERKGLSAKAEVAKVLIDRNAALPMLRAENLSGALSNFWEIEKVESKSGEQYYKIYYSHTEAVLPVDEQTKAIREKEATQIWNYDKFCEDRKKDDERKMFDIWLEPLSEWAEAVEEGVSKDEDGNPQTDSKTREAIDYIRKSGDRYIETANSLTKALYLINKEIKSIYRANKSEAEAIKAAEETVDYFCYEIEDQMCQHTEWNFYGRFEDYIGVVPKTIRVVDALIPAQKEYQAIIDAKASELSNDDILYRSSKLLQEYPQVLQKVRDKFDRLYVDEFQDTTKLQAGIVKLLAEEKQGSFRGDKLIIVGDPKQSIYRFTGAEKAVYDSFNVAVDNANNGERLVLKENFRSNKAVVDWINDSFAKLMPNDYNPMETDWEISDEDSLYGVFCYDPEPEKTVSTVEEPEPEEEQERELREEEQEQELREGEEKTDDIDEQQKSKGKNSVDYNATEDAIAVAMIIRDLTEGGYSIEDHDTRKSRPIKYSDFMVITKYTSNISTFVKVFGEYDIPVEVNGKFDISGNETVRNFKAVLDYLANHKDKRNELVAVQAYKGIDITNCDEDKRKEALAQLRDLRHTIEDKGLSPAGVVQYLVSNEEIYVPKGKTLDRNAVREYRMHLTQMVEACIRDEYGDLAEIVKNVERYMDINVSRGILLESDENAVRLMNVHKAKGLTANIVIIANRKDSEEPRYGGFKKDGKYYPAASYKVIDVGKPDYFPSFAADEELWELAKKEEMEENIRLQYVAATRAANALIIMPYIDKPVGKKVEELEPWEELKKPWFESKEYCSYDGEIRRWMSAYSNENVIKEEPESPLDKAKKRRSDLLDAIATTNMEALKSARTVNINPSGLETNDVTGYKPQNSDYKSESRPKGDVFGTILHRTFELYIKYKTETEHNQSSDTKAEFESIINRAIIESEDKLKESKDAKDIKEYLTNVLEKYSLNVLDPIIDAADEIYPEFRFSFYVANEEKAEFERLFDECIQNEKLDIVKGDEYWVNGTSDLVVKQKNGVIKVFDYKSDSRNGKPKGDFDESVAQKYKYQLLLYKYAMGKVFGVNMDDVETEIIDLYR